MLIVYTFKRTENKKWYLAKFGPLVEFIAMLRPLWQAETRQCLGLVKMIFWKDPVILVTKV